MITSTSPEQAEREALDRLSGLQAPAELRAALLALLLTPGSQRERRAWQDETRGLSTARRLHDLVKQLNPAQRLPYLERWLARLAKSPLPDRQAVLEAARRVMAADGLIRPIDRLHWLALRHRLGEAPPAPAIPDAQNDMSELSLHTLREIGRVTAYLSRLVPDAAPAQGSAWYGAVMGPWLAPPRLPRCEPPDADGLVNALAEVQALPWMLRPVLMRAWFDAAAAHSPNNRLGDGAADALRLMALLLDCPVSPGLARYFTLPPREA